ncbi:isatin hydrolase-like [Ylistrum balloti]|uniref:isatin hydrolase-like n=1 Tax=Ylistrum balloti TaxID=509963 RepID=UPI0029058614|nr:isatin hydrolase-like [Ylistrum balloti]
MAGHVLFCLTVMVFITKVPSRRVVDLSYDMDYNSLTYPINPRFNLSIQYSGPYGTAPWLEFGNVEFAEHTGTHVDSPNHFDKNGLQAHQVSLEQLMGPGVVINVKANAANDIDYQVTDQDLMAWEEKHGRIPNGAIILMNSGWGSRYPDFASVYNSSTFQEDFSSLHYPGFHLNAAQWLVNNRDINAIGCDTPSADYGRSSSFPVHQLVMKEGILIIENIANMDKLPASGSYIYVPMLKFRGGTGSPARMFAAIEDEGDRTNSATSVFSFVSVVGYVAILALF